jgi:hypothetical protein
MYIQMTGEKLKLKGPKAPGKICNSARNEKELHGLLANRAIQRLAGFANGMSVALRFSGANKLGDRRTAQLCTEGL